MKSTKNEMEHFNVGYNKGLVEGYAQGKIDGTREFAEWLIHQDKVMYDPVSKDFYTCDDEHYIISTLSIDEVLAEWQKGKESK